MPSLYTSINFQTQGRVLGFGIKTVFSFSFLPSVFVLLSSLSTCTFVITLTHNSLAMPCRVTNFSWALDFSMTEGEKEKIKERAEAVGHCELTGICPHCKELHIPPLILLVLGLLSSGFVSLAGASPKRVRSLCGIVSIWSLFTLQFLVLETKHKQCTQRSHLWRKIEI